MVRRNLFYRLQETAGLVLPVLFLSFFAVSCIDQGNNSTGSRNKAGSSSTSFYGSVGVGNARILTDNPIILSKNTNYSSTNFTGLLSEQKITDGQFLIGSCAGNGSGYGDVSSCYQVLEKEFASPITYVNKRWAYGIATSEWTQVQGYYHLKKEINTFTSTLKNVYDAAWSAAYQSSIPAALYSSGSNWYKGKVLTLYTNDGVLGSAYYSPSVFKVSLGSVNKASTLLMVQDPSVQYHETGHVYVSIMMNMRNASRTDRSELGYLYYDEGGAINEGLADYFSFYMNRRTHLAEWALARFLGVSRPITEDDPLHMAGISSDDDSRLAYPTFLIYDPNSHTIPTEEIHNAGMITSHFLVALTEEFQNHCLMTQSQAVDTTMRLIAETLAELGDLTAKGNDSSTDSVNLNSTSSLDFVKKITPINYRSFYQTMAKYLYLAYGQNASACYLKDDIEHQFDRYGLLLFDTYNLNGNNLSTGHAGTNASINSANRLKTVLINKDLIVYSPSTSVQAFVFDSQTQMASAIDSMQASGLIGQLSTQIPSDLSLNNGNGKVSAGEVVGIALNLYNSSNSPMAGIQVLGNDWDHFSPVTTSSEAKPCSNMGDSFPTVAAGGTANASCNYVTRYNGALAGTASASLDNSEELYPVCFVEKISDSSSQWVSQSQLVSKLPSPSNCLGGSTNKKDCFLRAIKGADTAYYSYLAPNKTWGSTFTYTDSSGVVQTPSYQYSNLVFFEVNPRTPPGTKFNCRFRVRFSNCSDCYQDSANSNDNFLDYEYSGHAPYKVFNLQFTITD